jgi:hypothetical protein
VSRVLDDPLKINGCDFLLRFVGDLEFYFLNERDVGGDILLEGDLGAELLDKGEDDTYLLVGWGEQGYFDEHLHVDFRQLHRNISYKQTKIISSSFSSAF